MPFFDVTLEQRFVGTQMVEGDTVEDAKKLAIQRASHGNFNKRFINAKATKIVNRSLSNGYE